MFQFKTSDFHGMELTEPFQYIICFSLRNFVKRLDRILIKFQYIICFSSRTNIKEWQEQTFPFQYIICFSSSIAFCPCAVFAVKFQYIICFSSRNSKGTICLPREISIHYMFQFKNSLQYNL